MPQLRAALVPAPDQVVVRLSGDADLSTARLLTDALTQAAGLGTRQVVVDVARTRFWDCSGLHALVDFTVGLDAAGRACRIVGAPPATRRLIAAADLTDRLNLGGPLRELPAPPVRPVPRPVGRREVPLPAGRSPVPAVAGATRSGD